MRSCRNPMFGMAANSPRTVVRQRASFGNSDDHAHFEGHYPQATEYERKIKDQRWQPVRSETSRHCWKIERNGRQRNCKIHCLSQ